MQSRPLYEDLICGRCVPFAIGRHHCYVSARSVVWRWASHILIIMKQLNRLAFLLIVGLLGLLPRIGSAQDQVTVKTDPYGGGVACWDLTVKNNNQPGHLPINRVVIRLTTAGASFTDGALGPVNWNVTQGTDSILYVSGGASITYPNSLSGFGFCLDNPVYDEPVTLQWATMSNASVVTTGTITIIPLTFQTLARLDTVTGTGSVVNNDPCFNFNVFNNNSLTVGIDAMSFEVQGQTAGTIRPGSVVPPAGWVFDSATINRAYFHSTLGNAIDGGKSLSGFKVCLRGNPSFPAFNWVWRASHEGFLIDRDTLRNLTVSGSFTADASNDSVTAARQTGCLYNFTLKNYHTLNAAPPSSIDKLVLRSITSGVKFLAATTTPPNWGKAISTAGDVLTYQSASSNDAIASGQVSSFFAANIDNPTSGAFQLRWIAYHGSLTIDSAVLNLTCSAAPPANDEATIAPNGDCAFKISVVNKHSPPSNIASITVGISGAKFTGSPAVTPSTWSALVINDQTLKFQSSSSSDYLSTNAIADLLFQITATTTGPAALTWSTFDANNTKISTGTLNATCQALSVDKITITPENAATCRYALLVENDRGNGSSITSIVVEPTGGWKVDTLAAAAGWTTSVDANGIATLTNSIGIPDFTQQGFHIGFKGVGTQSDFKIYVATTNNDQVTKRDTISMTCSPTSGVPDGKSAELTLSVAPNPVHESATITYSLQYPEFVTLTLIDVMGRVRSTIVSEMSTDGEHAAHFESTSLPAGTYYLRLETPSSRLTHKIVIQ
jgi:hypothetical protein